MQLAADDVVRTFGPALARIVSSYERNAALRDELLQEVFMAVITALPRLADRRKLKPFVFRIAHNRCVAHVARCVRERSNEESLDDLAGNEANQEQHLIEQERGRRLLDAVRRLGLPYRQVITLVLEDLSHEEIADALGISVVNVGVRVNRAKQQLKALLCHE